MTHDDAAALAQRCKLTLLAYDDARAMLWVVDDVSYAALVARLRKQGAWPGIIEYDPVNRPGQLGIVVKELTS